MLLVLSTFFIHLNSSLRQPIIVSDNGCDTLRHWRRTPRIHGRHHRQSNVGRRRVGRLRGGRFSRLQSAIQEGDWGRHIRSSRTILHPDRDAQRRTIVATQCWSSAHRHGDVVLGEVAVAGVVVGQCTFSWWDH